MLREVHNFLDDSLEDEEAIRLGGLRVFCTIDSRLQRAAEEGLDEHLSSLEQRSGWQHPKRTDHAGKDLQFTDYVQGAVVSIDNQTGGILAYVGGRSFNESPFNRAVLARRQVRSTFKPFIYAVAFDRRGLLPGTYVDDGPIRFPDNGRVWSPRNYDGTYQGNKPAAWGLIKSRNTMAVRVGQIAGMDNVKGLTDALYFGEIPESPVSYLGAFESTPMTLTSAYSTFAAGGKNFAPYLIDRIENSAGKVLFKNQVRGDRIFRESVAWMTTDILGKAVDEGTGQSARSTYGYTTPAYGKTGTTNDNKDAWFVGFTDKITTGVWIGLDNPKTIMYKGTGSSLALPVWVRVMQTADEAGYQGEAIAPPEGTELVYLCRECGLEATSRTPEEHIYQMLVPPDLRPTERCKGHDTMDNIFTRTSEWYRQRREEAFRPAEESREEKPVVNAFKRFGDWIMNR